VSTILGPDGKPAFTACPNCEAAMARFNEAVKSIIVMRAQARLLNEAMAQRPRINTRPPAPCEFGPS
jgi:hypothetical protein